MHDRGVAYYDKHDYDRSIADFEQLAASNANLVAAASSKDTALDRQRSFDRAGEPKLAVRPIKLSPSFARAFNDRGVTFGAKGELDRAIADYDQALKINSGYSTAYYNRGNAYYNKRDLESSVNYG